ncbi:response regulator, partial [Ochrobactrum sp. SFR4]
IVLDLMLPDGSGLDVLRKMRTDKDSTPVLLLTALDETSDRITGLDSGADDYMGKPFDLDELAARVRAIARRGAGRARAIMVAGDVELDPSSLNAKVKGERVPLSRRE